MQEFQLLMAKIPISFVTISETWVNKNTEGQLQLTGYALHSFAHHPCALGGSPTLEDDFSDYSANQWSGNDFSFSERFDTKERGGDEEEDHRSPEIAVDSSCGLGHGAALKEPDDQRTYNTVKQLRL